MENQKSHSEFDLLKGRVSFVDEPLWLRLITYLLLILFWGFVIWHLGSVAYMTLAAKHLKNSVVTMVGKNRSP